MINLLFITNDKTHHLNKQSFYLSQQLAKLTNLTLWFTPGNISEILKQIPEKPDFILLNDVDKMTAPLVNGFSSVDIHCGMIIEDPHKYPPGRRRFIENNNFSILFPVVRDAFKKMYPTLTNEWYWFPHHVNTDVFKDYKLKKTIDYLMIGKIDKLYPLRKKMYEHLKDEAGFTYHNHPGYRNFTTDQEKRKIVGINYAKTINKAKLFFTCDSIYQYPLKKYYEVLACRTLLLAPTSKEIEDLGFIPGTHFIEINEENFYEKAQYYLQHEKEREEIATNGYKFVHEQHSTKQRAEQLVNKITDIVNGKNHDFH